MTGSIDSRYAASTADESRVLRGMKVIDFTEFLSGPYCTWILAQLGADVIKIERVGGDRTRRRILGKSPEPVPFHMIHGNKRSVCVDVKTQEGREIVTRMAASADVFVENFRPGVSERLGLGETSLRSTHPGLIYCSIRGFREGTEYANLAGVDTIAQALGGLASVTGDPEGPPLPAGFPVADLGAGMWAALGILAAYASRATTGVGDHVKASLLDGVIAWGMWDMGYYLMTGENPRRHGSAHLYMSPFEFFECLDGKPIALGVGNDRHWQLLCDILGRRDLISDPRYSELYERGRHAVELRAELTPIFRARPAADWVSILVAAGIPVSPILSIQDIAEGRYVRESGMMAEIQGFHGKTQVMGFPVEFAHGRLNGPRAAPLLGADTRTALTQCGFTEQEVTHFAAGGVISLGD